jgi:hypothetical protein
MTELENRDRRFTKKSMNIFKRDDEILYLYKNYVFNERIKDRIILRYDLDPKETSGKEDENYFNIYPEIPKKLSLRRCWKYRKAIQNFVIYQYSKYADTFVERKILKETKVDVIYIYNKQQYRYLFPFTLISGLILRSYYGVISIMCLSLISYKFDFFGNIIFLFNLNDMLMRYQINTYFNLGKEAKEFVNYLEADRNEKIVKFENRNKEYFDKFFVDEILDIKFEKGERLVDYLKAENISVDYHRQYLKKLETEYKNNNNNL